MVPAGWSTSKRDASWGVGFSVGWSMGWHGCRSKITHNAFREERLPASECGLQKSAQLGSSQDTDPASAAKASKAPCQACSQQELYKSLSVRAFDYLLVIGVQWRSPSIEVVGICSVLYFDNNHRPSLAQPPPTTLNWIGSSEVRQHALDFLDQTKAPCAGSCHAWWCWVGDLRLQGTSGSGYGCRNMCGPAIGLHSF